MEQERQGGHDVSGFVGTILATWVTPPQSPVAVHKALEGLLPIFLGVDGDGLFACVDMVLDERVSVAGRVHSLCWTHSQARAKHAAGGWHTDF